MVCRRIRAGSSPFNSIQKIYRLKISANVERMDLWFVNSQLYEYLSPVCCNSLFCNLIGREKG